MTLAVLEGAEKMVTRTMNTSQSTGGALIGAGAEMTTFAGRKQRGTSAAPPVQTVAGIARDARAIIANATVLTQIVKDKAPAQ